MLARMPLQDSTGKAGSKEDQESLAKDLADAAGVSLGPISLSFGDDFKKGRGSREAADHEGAEQAEYQSIAGMTTEEWRRQYEQNGYVDLWVEEEFNAGSRLVVSVAGTAPVFASFAPPQ